MAYPRYGKSFGMWVGGWWGQWRLDSRDVQWSLIGCLIFRSKFFFASFQCIKNLVLTFLFEYTNWSFGSDFLYNSIISASLVKLLVRFRKDPNL